MKTSPFLTEDLSTTRTPLVLPRDKLKSTSTLFLEGGDFLFHLTTGCHYFDCMTYSFSYNHHPHLRRLLTGIPPGKKPQLRVEHRLLEGVHSKLYLCYIDGSLSDVFLGSMNLAHSTNLNLMYRIRSKTDKQILVRYFDHLWNLAK